MMQKITRLFLVNLLAITVWSGSLFAAEQAKASRISGSLTIDIEVGKINNILSNTTGSQGRIRIGQIKQSNITGNVNLNKIQVDSVNNTLTNTTNSSAKVNIGAIQNSTVRNAEIRVDIKNVDNKVTGGSNNHAIINVGSIINSNVNGQLNIDVSLTKSISNEIARGSGNRAEVSIGSVGDGDEDDEGTSSRNIRSNINRYNQFSDKNFPKHNLIADKNYDPKANDIQRILYEQKRYKDTRGKIKGVYGAAIDRINKQGYFALNLAKKYEKNPSLWLKDLNKWKNDPINSKLRILFGTPGYGAGTNTQEKQRRIDKIYRYAKKNRLAYIKDLKERSQINFKLTRQIGNDPISKLKEHHIDFFKILSSTNPNKALDNYTIKYERDGKKMSWLLGGLAYTSFISKTFASKYYANNTYTGRGLKFVQKFTKNTKQIFVTAGQNLGSGRGRFKKPSKSKERNKNKNRECDCGKGKKKGKCFVAGTQVLTDNGFRLIEDLRLGDLVVSKNFSSGESELKPVTSLFNFDDDRETYRLAIKDKFGVVETYELTDNHPFYVKDLGWVNSIDLKEGMDLVKLDGSYVQVDSLTPLYRSPETFNIEVEGNHNYYVGQQQVLVHNSSKSTAKKGNCDCRLKIKLKDLYGETRPSFRLRVKAKLKKLYPNRHNKSYLRAYLKKGQDRRHKVPLHNMIEHTYYMINGRKYAEIEKLFNEVGRTVKGSTGKITKRSIKSAARKLVRDFHNYVDNLRVGSASGNRSVQNTPDYAKGTSVKQMEVHELKLRKLFYLGTN